ncbi:hypothetical protein ACFO25_15660 [Paenactinomyces guangxiensis]|uniref:Membrane protein NfeD2 N-terminal transmembrane domain-containing protein n=1 Tax=Paenactinomyces guangxiensis TaxID=1490290 RepID=A0A7W1WU34_9BACL|nr:hypothetical protein [Paenactinomyces guangxiensis]MBA4496018.1 hypothetical protein [Paenactinomyces guangxiensis]MBH8593106.1 hypothetical protein [Paenactinomyces guangxiensis]
MQLVFWGCLIFGVVFTILIVLIGDLLAGIVDALFDIGFPFNQSPWSGLSPSLAVPD